MLTSHQFGTGLCSGVASLCLCAVCATPVEAQSDANAPLYDASTCRLVMGQAEIDGVMQQISGRACLQPDGSWQIVQDDADADALAFGPAPVYYYDPWYWGPPVVFAAGVSVIFVDRFHHFHPMNHVHYAHGSYRMGARGGWHGASLMRWGGMSHGGGGGMRR